jgi:hypothetical protein
MQPIENSAKLSQNPSKSVKFHPKIRTRLELSNFGGWRAASPTAFIRISGHKTGLQPVLIHPTANFGDRAKMNVLSLNNLLYFRIHPYAGDQYDLPADLILVTHGHFDHCAIDTSPAQIAGCPSGGCP